MNRKIKSPGEVLGEKKTDLNFSDEEISKLSGISAEELYNLYYDEICINENIAKGLAKAFKTTPKFWIDINENYVKNVYKRNKNIIQKFMTNAELPLVEIVDQGEYINDFEQYPGEEDACSYFLKIIRELISEKKLVSIKIYNPKIKRITEYVFPAGSRALSEDELAIKDIIE